MKNTILVLLAFISMFTFSAKVDNTLSQNYKKLLEQTKKDAKIDYKLLYGYTNKWWLGYNNDELNNFISNAFTASTNIKTMQKRITDIENNYNKVKTEKDTSDLGRINIRDNEVKLDEGLILRPEDLKIKTIYSTELINKLDISASNKNSGLEILELEAVWASSTVSMLAAKLYGYSVYLENEEINLQQRLNILKELEKLEEIKLSLKRSDGEDLINVQNLKYNLEKKLSENIQNKRITERSMESLLGGNKQAVKQLIVNIKNNPDTAIYEKIQTEGKVASDSIKSRVDTGFYLILIKTEKESLYPFTAPGYENFWIIGDDKNITTYEDTIKKQKISDSLYFQRYEENNYFNQKPSQELINTIKQYNETVLNSYNNVNSVLREVKETMLKYKDDNEIFNEQKKIFADKKIKLDSGVISKYDYYRIEYNYLTQELNNKQIGFKTFINKIDLIYNLGGQNEAGRQ